LGGEEEKERRRENREKEVGEEMGEGRNRSFYLFTFCVSGTSVTYSLLTSRKEKKNRRKGTNYLQLNKILN